MSYLSLLDMKSICLKITGESLMGENGSLDTQSIDTVVSHIKEIISRRIKLCVVLGGGNIYRGNLGKQRGADPVLSDQIGMMATVINALALFEALNRWGVPSQIYSAIPFQGVVEEFHYSKAYKDFNDYKVVIFCAGLGQPFFTTDTACVLRALEMNVDLLMKGTKVDGIYNDDPHKNPKAKKYDLLSYHQAIEKRLMVMDHTAFSLCIDKKLPLIVYNFFKKEALLNILNKEKEGTLILPDTMMKEFNLREQEL